MLFANNCSMLNKVVDKVSILKTGVQSKLFKTSTKTAAQSPERPATAMSQQEYLESPERAKIVNMLTDPYRNDVFITNTLQPTPKNIVDFSKNLGRTLNWIAKIPEKLTAKKSPVKMIT